MFGRKKTQEQAVRADRRSGSDRTLTHDFQPSEVQIKRATRTRFVWTLITSLLLLISVAFLILVELGDTKASGVRSTIWFLKLNVSNIVPVSVPSAQLIDSIAQSLGLHDFYTVGLWGYCEGYNGQGTTECSSPQTLYWFNPVEILESQLLSGATIDLPAEITKILSLIRIVSQWMFGLFLTGACLDFVLIFLMPLSVFSRWAALPVAILTFLGALLTTVATVIATVMFIIFQRVIVSATELNIGAELGVRMFAFMWIAAACSILAWLVQMGLCCCCASRRDVRRGKKRGNKKAWEGSGSVAGGDDVIDRRDEDEVKEKPARRRGFPVFKRKQEDLV